MNKEEKKAIKELSDYIVTLFNAKNLKKYKVGYQTKLIAQIMKFNSIMTNNKTRKVFDDIEDWLSQEGQDDWRAWDSDYLDKYDKLKEKYVGGRK